MCAEKIPLVMMGSRAEGQVCADPGASTPISISGIKFIICIQFQLRKRRLLLYTNTNIPQKYPECLLKKMSVTGTTFVFVKFLFKFDI